MKRRTIVVLSTSPLSAVISFLGWNSRNNVRDSSVVEDTGKRVALIANERSNDPVRLTGTEHGTVR
jgi:hypothetical protein